jgi:hypothetical protein
MVINSASVINMTKVASLVLTICLSIFSGAQAQGTAPFQQLAGQWSGSGTIDLANGTHESIKCKASYDVLEERNNLQLNIRCASDSYNFDLRGSATYAAGAIKGTWSESTRNAAGTISGTANRDQFQIVATGPSFSASMTLTVRADSQSVVIKSQDAKATLKSVSIAFQRS